MEKIATNNDQILETIKQATNIKDDQLDAVKALSRVYGDEIHLMDLAKAVMDQPIPEGSEGKWHSDGIRKSIYGKLTTSRSDCERAKAISRKMARFMTEDKDIFLDIPKSEQKFIQELHQNTGSEGWMDEEVLKDRIALHKDLLEEMGADFSSTPPEELNVRLTDKSLVSFMWKKCGHSESRRAAQINTSLNKGAFARCAYCRKIENSFISWYQANLAFLQLSGLDISGLTEDELLDSSYSKRIFEVGYGCGHKEMTSFQSIKAKHKRAMDMGQGYIACNRCKVSDGTFEIAIRAYLQALVNLTPGVEFDWQVEIDGLRRGMNYDLLLVATSGTKYLIEVDGGYHYRSHSSAEDSVFEQRVEIDAFKTLTALQNGYSMIRIDERNHRGIVPTELSDILHLAARGELGRYTVVGEECPGAKSVFEKFVF